MSSGTTSKVTDPVQMDGVTDSNKLKEKFNKESLVGYITHLRSRIEELESYQLISRRIELLERSDFKNLQYGRRESIEIAGIPETVDDFERKSIAILNSIGVDKIEWWQVHRLKNRKNTVIRFTTRKFADSALHNRSKLKESDKTKIGLPPKTQLFVNESLCRPLGYLYYHVRQAYERKKIASFNLWKGQISIKMTKESEPLNIDHYRDLINLELSEEALMAEFASYY